MKDRESLLFIDKSYEQLMEETIRELDKTYINHNSPGSIVRLLLSKVNYQIAEFYQMFKQEHSRGFLSKASEETLDLIGALVNCKRRPSESEEEYKYRISRATTNNEKANKIAVRLAALSVSGVKDVLFKEFSQGSGSFSVYVLTDNPTPSMQILKQVEQAIDEVKAFGIRVHVLAPKLKPVEMKVKLVFDKNVTELEKRVVFEEARRKIRAYINSRHPGDTIEINELIKQIREINRNIMKIDFHVFTINGQAVYAVDQSSKWNERFIESESPNAITVS